MGGDLGEPGSYSICGGADQQNSRNSVSCCQDDLGRLMHVMRQFHLVCPGIHEREYGKAVAGAGEALDDKAGAGVDNAGTVIDRTEHGVKYQGAPARPCSARPVPGDMNLHGIAVCHDLATKVIHRGWK